MQPAQFSERYQALMDEWHECDLEVENAEYQLRQLPLEQEMADAFVEHIRVQDARIREIVAELEQLRGR